MSDELIISIYLLLCFLYAAYRYGLFSVQLLVLFFVYSQSLSIFFRIINRADYIYYQNYALQDDHSLISYALMLFSLAFTVSLIVLRLIETERWSRPVLVNVEEYPRSVITQTAIIVSFFVLFRLTDKGGIADSVFNASYTQLLEKRIEGTEYAAVLGFVLWIFSFLIYISTQSLYDQRTRFFRFVFLAATIVNLLMFFLHSSRMPFLLIINSFVLYLILSKRVKAAVCIFVISILAMSLLGWLRELLYDSSLLLNEVEGLPNVSSLPGGAPNVFMSFVISCDYFSKNNYLYGETFINYLFQLVPRHIASLIDYTIPPYYESTGVFDDYDWNGGINVASIFYANFGVAGMLIYGAFVAFYIKYLMLLLKSKRIMLQVAGYYMFAFCLPIFWYELIQLLKPILFILFVFALGELAKIRFEKNCSI